MMSTSCSRATGLETFKQQWLGRGYVEKFPGSRGLRDTENNVTIDVVVAGDYPGDGKPKPVRFPDPAAVALRGERVRLVPAAPAVVHVGPCVATPLHVFLSKARGRPSHAEREVWT